MMAKAVAQATTASFISVVGYVQPSQPPTPLSHQYMHHSRANHSKHPLTHPPTYSSEFVQKYLGEGPRMVRDVFRLGT